MSPSDVSPLNNTEATMERCVSCESNDMSGLRLRRSLLISRAIQMAWVWGVSNDRGASNVEIFVRYQQHAGRWQIVERVRSFVCRFSWPRYRSTPWVCWRCGVASRAIAIPSVRRSFSYATEVVIRGFWDLVICASKDQSKRPLISPTANECAQPIRKQH